MLVFRRRTGLDDADAVPNAGDLVFVVSLNLAVRAHNLAVQRVLLTVFELDDNGLLHFVRYDVADPNLAGALSFSFFGVGPLVESVTVASLIIMPQLLESRSYPTHVPEAPCRRERCRV